MSRSAEWFRDAAASCFDLLGEAAVIDQLHWSPDSNCGVVLGPSLVFRAGNVFPIDPSAESAVWAEARRHGVPAPLLRATGEIAGEPYLVYGLIPGRPPEVNDHQAMAQCLVRIHACDARSFPAVMSARPRRRQRSFHAWRGLDRLRPVLDPSVSRAAERWLAAGQQDQDDIGEVPCHHDYRRANLLVERGELTGVLDWSDAALGSREADLGGVDLNSLLPVVTYYEREVGPASVDPRLVAAYCAARHLALFSFGVMSARECCSALGSPALDALSA